MVSCLECRPDACEGKKGDRIPWMSGLFMVDVVVRVGRSSFGYVYAVRHV